MSKRTTQTQAQPASEVAAPEALETEVAAPEALETEVLVSAVYGDLRHLFTNAVFTKEPQKAKLDSFLQVQLDAGKLKLHDNQ